MNTDKKLSEILRQHAHVFAPVFATDLSAANVCPLDFTAANTRLQHTDLRDTAAFDKVVQQMLAEQDATIGVGGYMENRAVYSRSAHFDGAAQNRSLHLGVDVWLEAGAEVYAPLDGRVHSFQDNANFGDYGPTIILQHELDGVIFYTLYGHLSRTSLEGLSIGKHFSKGDMLATVGPFPENGDWPPHLHFQVMADMGGRSGDFPGVAATAEREYYEALCPNPNLILQSRHLPL